ncbi:hypothetical protein NIES22_56130 [Calothrix brevissima NIES-22]|nr:hypothetical protein NIES22_56130 [Calothrix brevissima NIES-22]
MGNALPLREIYGVLVFLFKWDENLKNSAKNLVLLTFRYLNSINQFDLKISAIAKNNKG